MLWAAAEQFLTIFNSNWIEHQLETALGCLRAISFKFPLELIHTETQRDTEKLRETHTESFWNLKAFALSKSTGDSNRVSIKPIWNSTNTAQQPKINSNWCQIKFKFKAKGRRSGLPRTNSNRILNKLSSNCNQSGTALRQPKSDSKIFSIKL